MMDESRIPVMSSAMCHYQNSLELTYLSNLCRKWPLLFYNCEITPESQNSEVRIDVYC
jgi:hypothetical protein